MDDFISLEVLPANCDRALVVPLMDKALTPYVKGDSSPIPNPNPNSSSSPTCVKGEPSLHTAHSTQHYFRFSASALLVQC